MTSDATAAVPDARAAATAAPSAHARPGFFGLELLDNRYPALHGIRVIAILSVIQYHVTWIIGTYPQVTLDSGPRDFSLSIFFGMDCFFVLSGFLIGSILLRSIDTSGSQNIRRFYLRRVFRTFPSYWIVLTLLAITAHLTSAQRMHLIYEYAYLTNFAPLRPDKIIMFWGWSLSLEEQFYLAVPLLFVVLRWLPTDRARVVFLALLTLSCTVLRVGIYVWEQPFTDNGLYDALYFRTATRYDTIVAGILLALLEARWGPQIAKWLEPPSHRALLIVPALGCAWLLLRPDLFGDEHEQHVHLFTWGLVTSIMYLLIVPMALHGHGWVVRFLSQPFWRALATVGYGVYLLHIPVMNRIGMPMILRMNENGTSLAFAWVVVFCVVTAVSFIAGYVLHVFVEKPALRLREWLAA